MYNSILLKNLIVFTIFSGISYFFIGMNEHINQLKATSNNSDFYHSFSTYNSHPEVLYHRISKDLLMSLTGKDNSETVNQSYPSSTTLNTSNIITPKKLLPKSAFVNLNPPAQAVNISLVNHLETTVAEKRVKTFSVPTKFQGQRLNKVTLLHPEKVVALTFDDGPWPNNTQKILDILKNNNIKATFFWIGQNVKAYPKIAQEVVVDGHAIGNHTWHHWYHRMNQPIAAHEIDATADIIYKTTGVKTALFRPPGGVLNNGVADYAKQKKYAIVMWSVDPMEYRRLPTQKLVNNVMSQVRPGAIILLHDGGGNHAATIQALPQIITKLEKLGYQFVTIPELLEMKEKQPS